MTVINGIESEELKRRKNDIQAAIQFNDKIEEKLNVVMMISNPCEYKRRWFLAKEFIDRMLDNDDVNLYIVELAYKDQAYHVTEADNKNHLQLRTTTPLWHKENCINLGVKYLLPSNWKAMAWIDADIEFESPNWASDTLKILNGAKDVVQLFSHALDMDKDENTMQTFTGFGYNYETAGKYIGSGKNFSHPGFCFSCTRKAYDKMGGLFDWSIVGSGDFQMTQALINNANSINAGCSIGYKKKIQELVKRSRNLRIGYVPGVIRHFFHGTKENRKYNDRWKILVKHQYDPFQHMTYDEMGVIVPTSECPSELITDIFQYFTERLEDD